MIKNYLITAFRNILKHRVYSLLNIIGLSIGMTVFLLILLQTHFELSFDKFHKDSDKIYRVEKDVYSRNETSLGFPTHSGLLGPILKNEYPEVVSYTRVFKNMEPIIVTYNNTSFFE